MQVQRSGSLIDFLLPASHSRVFALTPIRQGLLVRIVGIRQDL